MDAGTKLSFSSSKSPKPAFFHSYHLFPSLTVFIAITSLTPSYWNLWLVFFFPLWTGITVWMSALTVMGTYPSAVNSPVLANLGHKEGLGSISPGWRSLVPVCREPFSPCTSAPAAERPHWSQTLCLSLHPTRVATMSLFAFRKIHSSVPVREQLNNQESQII